MTTRSTNHALFAMYSFAISLHPVKFGAYSLLGSTDTSFFIFHVAACDLVVEGSLDFTPYHKPSFAPLVMRPHLTT